MSRIAAGRKLIWRRSAGFTPATVRPTDSAKNAMPNDMAKRGWRTVAQIGSMYPDTEACTRSSHETRGWGARTVSSQALGVNARCGCQDVADQAGWRLHLRETLQPVAARLSFGEQRPARLATPGVGLEAVEFAPAQDAVNGIREQEIELVALHSVTGLVWHHITCL